MKKQQNKTLRIASVLLVLALVTTVALTGTLARYTAAAESESQYARVAAFRVLVNGAPIDDDFTFDLFDNLRDHDMADADLAALSAADYWKTANEATDVVNLYSDPDEIVIAPGMGSYANIEIHNLSEVPVVAAITGGAAAATIAPPANLVFYVDDAAAAPLTDATFAGLDTDDFTYTYATFLSSLAAIDLAPGAAAPTTINVAWRWVYTNDLDYDLGTNDSGDTTEGTAVADFLDVLVGPDAADLPTDAGALYGFDLAALKLRVTQAD